MSCPASAAIMRGRPRAGSFTPFWPALHPALQSSSAFTKAPLPRAADGQPAGRAVQAYLSVLCSRFLPMRH